ncbi:MAG: hypothetical protein M3276_07670 [Actinomycetota bacterium]|nr:hypothetical protein [Actinomycetota bacterium]
MSATAPFSRQEQNSPTVAVAFPLKMPGLGSVQSFTWEISHSEQVDQYRGFPSR